MTAKIIHFHNEKEISIVDVVNSNKENIYNIILKVNNFPIELTNVYIKNINKNKVQFSYGSFKHFISTNKRVETCPFCGEPFTDSICSSLTQEVSELFNKHISKNIFIPMILSSYDKKEDGYLQDLLKNILPDFETLFYGISEGKYIQCVFKYNNELLIFQDVFDTKSFETIPLVFYFDEQSQQLHLYTEYLIPEKLLPITTTINHYLHQPKVSLKDTTGRGLLDIYLEYKNKK
ncbi:hypothetical protein [Bacillus toyonensis]|uniref:hypothetical protein n=1 Tax=Bacillus toyonensis TaxID=155322 RepID=UPI002E1BD179|nr:hypothetical protein [Bacillus toyonensis]